jgi:hypothetical protein
MFFYKHKHIFLAITLVITSCSKLLCSPEEMVIIGGGIAGGMEAYYAYLDAKKNNAPLRITIYEKNSSILDTTITNIVPSLTCDEILSVVPRGPELVKKLGILFSNPGGIRVEDVEGVHGTDATEQFKQEVQNYSFNEAGHKQRTQDLLSLGKMSMDMWQGIYDNADPKLKHVLELANFNPCREPLKSGIKKLHDGYRIDLIYNLPNAQEHANRMKSDYVALGYKECMILSPSEAIAIDPFIKSFCESHSVNNIWNNDTVALWRPGGCLDAQVFLPKLYEYLQEAMGTFINAQGKQENCFQIKFGKKVTGVEFACDKVGKTVVAGLKFEDGSTILKENSKCNYVFCPGEAVGTLKKLGFCEPAYAGFAGVSLLFNIDIPKNKIKDYASYSHCMEVHQEGVVLPIQARIRNNKIFIGCAGTKAFYSDQRPTKNQQFAKNRSLLQLNMVNDVLPEFISLALGYETRGKTLTEKDLQYLEDQKIVTRWAGTRAVAYDGFPSLGHVYKNDLRVENARCTTHLGSGGGSFSPVLVSISRSAMKKEQDAFTQRILSYSNSARTATSVA